MEKILYAVWKSDTLRGDEFRDVLLNKLGPELLAADIERLKICVVDSAVAPAAPYRMEATRPPADAVIAVWVNSSVYRQPIETLIAAHTARLAGYLVTESEPLVNTTHNAEPGERSYGMNQIVFLQRPPRLSYAEWIDVWHGSHTQIAIDTQATFGYRQNVVTRQLSYGAPAYDAIIEENFPEAAISDRAAFYDAAGDEKLFLERQQAMVDSCVRFIDFDKIDCIPMSEYILR